MNLTELRQAGIYRVFLFTVAVPYASDPQMYTNPAESRVAIQFYTALLLLRLPGLFFEARRVAARPHD